MRYREANLWDIHHRFSLVPGFDTSKLWIVFTANSMVTKKGCLVMGAGIAREVRDRYPNIDHYFGQTLAMNNLIEREFNLLAEWPNRILALQTKMNWRDPSPLSLVSRSCDKLNEFARMWSECQFLMTMPGCGHGGLDPSVVMNIVAKLPDNVIICDRSLACSPSLA